MDDIDAAIQRQALQQSYEKGLKTGRNQAETVVAALVLVAGGRVEIPATVFARVGPHLKMEMSEDLEGQVTIIEVIE